MTDVRSLLGSFNCRPPATDSMIAETEKQLNTRLPMDYTEFLKITNGGEGFIGETSYVSLWSVDELISRNRDYEIEDNSPGFLAIGSDGGGEAYGFDMRTPQHCIVQLPFIGMDWNAAIPMGDLFDEFLKNLFDMPMDS